MGSDLLFTVGAVVGVALAFGVCAGSAMMPSTPSEPLPPWRVEVTICDRLSAFSASRETKIICRSGVYYYDAEMNPVREAR
jgi:hypothetical protein